MAAIPGMNGGSVSSGKNRFGKAAVCSVIPCCIKNYIHFDFIRFFLHFFHLGTDIAMLKVQGENLHGTAAGRVEFQREIRPVFGRNTALWPVRHGKKTQYPEVLK
jgi:hypothetical protein